MSIGSAWLSCARALLAAADIGVGDIMCRRAISTAYYGLFHTLTSAGAGAIATGDPELAARAAREFSHATMKKVCEIYTRADGQPPKADGTLIEVARAFVILQAARLSADYHLTKMFPLEEALRSVERAETACAGFEAVRHAPATRAFLAALLLGERLLKPRG